MWPNPKFPADSVAFTEVILNGKLHFLCRVINTKSLLMLNDSVSDTDLSLREKRPNTEFFLVRIFP